jgi:hypothetical protein
LCQVAACLVARQLLACLSDPLGQQLLKKLFLARKVLIERADRTASLGRDIRDPRIEIARAGEHPASGFLQRGPGLGRCPGPAASGLQF